MVKIRSHLAKAIVKKGAYVTFSFTVSLIIDCTCRQQFLVPLLLYHPVFTIMIIALGSPADFQNVLGSLTISRPTLGCSERS